MVFRFATFDPTQDPDDFNPAFPPTPSSSPSATLCQPCEYTYTFTKTIVKRLVAAGVALILTAPASEFHDDEIRDRYAETRLHGINFDAHPEFHQRQLKEFRLKELKVATQKFSNEKIIGRGGFGTVYEGRLADGSLVAIKRRSKDSEQGTSEFEREIMVGSIIPPRHNLLPALGFCRTPKCRDLLLVSPLMINKSLDYHLTNHPERRSPLDWLTRRKIALGAARGLCCLHDLNIVHGDVKPSNVMLDEEFEPHIGDFGSVKFTDRRRSRYSVDGIKEAPVLPRNESEAGPPIEDFFVTNMICGTFGYMPPEYAMNGEYSVKMDVFAFGITLLELMTGRKKVLRVNDRSVSLRQWVEGFVVEGSWQSGVDPYLQGEYDWEETEKVIRLALLCTREAPRRRPSMAQVVRILEGHSIEERWEEYRHSDDRHSDEYLIPLDKIQGAVHHQNLVPLLGYCDGTKTKALIYQFMDGGNLRQNLSGDGPNFLTWRKRLQIAVDVAQSLDYLHHGCHLPIIHGDLSAANIWLNDKMQAKIADFGISAFEPRALDSYPTCPLGTPGYFDPEFYPYSRSDRKSDVYSFGIILFELITGHPAVIRGAVRNVFLLQWMTPIIETKEIQMIMDPRLQGKFDVDSAWKAVEIAESCTRLTGVERPDITHVLVALRQSLAIELASQ